jgi:hypothetical protein
MHIEIMYYKNNMICEMFNHYLCVYKTVQWLFYVRNKNEVNLLSTGK